MATVGVQAWCRARRRRANCFSKRTATWMQRCIGAGSGRWVTKRFAGARRKLGVPFPLDPAGGSRLDRKG
jgi:hypothetical protein